MKNLLLVISLFFILFSCKEERKIESRELTFLSNFPEIIDPESSVISLILNGDITTQTDISSIGKLDGDGSFTIYNDSENRTIVVKLSSLKPNREYNFTIDLSKLSTEALKFKGSIDAKFRTKGNSIVVAPELIKEGSSFKIRSLIRSSYPLSREDVVKSTKFGRSDIKFSVKGSGSKTFTLTTEPFESRGEEISLEFDSEVLGMKQNYLEMIYINNSSTFKLIDYYSTTNQNQKRVEIVTNGQFSKRENLSSYVKVEGGKGFKIVGDRNKIYVSGDFKSGQKYQFKILEGLTDSNGALLEEEISGSVIFNNRLPEIRFCSNGYIVPDKRDRSIKIESVNVKKVKVSFWKVYENNTFFYLNGGNLNQGRKSSNLNWNTSRLGDLIHNKEYQLFEKLNKTTITEISIPDSLIDDKGFYVVGINFNKGDMVYTKGEFAGNDYRSNPDNYSYLYQNGRIYKSLIFTDLGISVSKKGENYNLFINSLHSSTPIEGAKIEMISDKNQVLATSYSNEMGLTSLSIKKGANVIRVSKGEDLNFIKLSASTLNRSLYDIEGEEPRDKNDIFFYTDRGVYRPGEDIYLSGIIGNDSLDSELPLKIKLFTPDNRVKWSRVERAGSGKFFSTKFETSQDDPTGDWPVKVEFLGKTYHYKVKVHTVIPHKIRVKSNANLENSSLEVELNSQFLNGVAYGGGKYSSSMVVTPYKHRVKKFKSFRFYGGIDPFSPIRKDISKGKLDSLGRVGFSYNLDKVVDSRSFSVDIINQVYQPSGRVVESRDRVDRVEDNIFVGVDRGFVERVDAGEESSLKFIITDREGNPLVDRVVDIEFYNNNSIWWYEYNNRSSFKKFVEHNSTILRERRELRSQSTPMEIHFQPESWGPLMVKIIDRESGRESITIVRSSWWESGDNLNDAEIVKISTDRLNYNSGDEIKLNLDCEPVGVAYVRIENGSKIFKEEVVNLSEIPTYKFDAIDEMAPGVYATIRVYQPESSRPERMLGITYLPIERAGMRSTAKISIPDRIEPLKEYSIDIDMGSSARSYYTVAIVDEGILNITDYKTPKPDSYFYSKELHNSYLYDNYSGIINSYNGLIDRKFSIGGGEGDPRKRGLNKVKANRFKPVAIFSGLLETGEDGKGHFRFKMPNYTGSVRVMVTGRSGKNYISGEKDVKVKADLSILPELPAVLGVDERVRIPITIFCDKVVNEDVTIKVNSSSGIVATPQSITLSPKERMIAEFDLKTDSSIGVKNIEIIATSGSREVKRDYSIALRPSSSFKDEDRVEVIRPGESLLLDIDSKGVLGTDIHNITVGTTPLYSLKGRASQLIRYPYGCLEQRTTKGYAQLLIRSLFKDNNKARYTIDRNINSLLDHIPSFAVSDGGFSLWRGGEFYPWVTNYVLNFIYDARLKGYDFNRNIEKKGLDRLKRYINKEKKDIRTVLESILILQKHGYNSLSRLHYFRELYLKKMGDYEKGLLAIAYNRMNEKGLAKVVYKTIDFGKVIDEDYNYYYSNSLALKAYMGSIQFEMGRKDAGYKVGLDILKSLEKGGYLSTYSTSKVMRSLESIFGELTVGSQFKVEVNGEELDNSDGKLSFENYSKDSFEIKNLGSDNIFLNHNYSYLPLKDDKNQKSYAGIRVKSKWIDRDRKPLNFNKVKRNSEIYQIITIENLSGRRVDQVAISQIIPPGLKPVNPALIKGAIPEYLYDGRRINTLSEDYRDDRVNIFLNLNNYGKRDLYIIKYDVTFEGDYFLPSLKGEAMYDGTIHSNYGGSDFKVVK